MLSIHNPAQGFVKPLAPSQRLEIADARLLPARLRLPAVLGLAVLLAVFALLPLATLGLTGALLSVAAAVPLLIQRRLSRLRGSAVSIARHRLYVGGREVLRRGDLSYVYLTEGRAGTTLHLLRGAEGPVELLLPDARRAREVLAQMDIEHLPVARFRVDSPASSRLPPWLAWGFAGVVVLSNAAGLQRFVSPTEIFALLMAWVGFAVLVGGVGAELSVGRDALVLRWFGSERVIPLERVAGVSAVVEGVRIELVDGDYVELHLRFAPPRYEGALSAVDSRTAWQAVILGAIRDAREGLATRAPEVMLPSLAEGDASAWIDAVRASATKRDGHYRERSLTEDRLWQAVESPRVRADQRAAAAIALGAHLDEPGRARMRIAAEGVATPKVRVALEAVARGDEEALLEAAQRFATAERKSVR